MNTGYPDHYQEVNDEMPSQQPPNPGVIRGRGRGRGRRYVQIYNSQQSQQVTPTGAKDKKECLHPVNDVNPVVEKILQQLSFPKKKAYEAKDVIWAKQNDAKWRICVVKYILSDTELMVRPFGKPQSSEIKIRLDEIHDTAESLSLQELQRCIESMKAEICNFHNDNGDIFEGSLIKCKGNLFGKVLTRNSMGKYTVQISNKCVWYNGEKLLKHLPEADIVNADEFELKYNVLQRERPGVKDEDEDGDYNEDEQSVYDFLDEIADQYIGSFLSNGIDRLGIILCLNDADLKEMKVKLGHRRYIMQKIKSFDAWKFHIYRVRKKEERAKEQSQSEKNKAPKLIIYDFEQTITCQNFYFDKSKSSSCVEKMDDEQLFQVFGGKERIKRLQTHFEILNANNIEIVILSSEEYGDVIKRVLIRANLFNQCFLNAMVIGSDSFDLKRWNNSKAKCILNTFRNSFRNLGEDDILFIDDDQSHIHQVKEHKICKAILIEPRQGMNDNHMVTIENTIQQKYVINDNYNEGNVNDHGGY